MIRPLIEHRACGSPVHTDMRSNGDPRGDCRPALLGAGTSFPVDRAAGQGRGSCALRRERGFGRARIWLFQTTRSAPRTPRTLQRCLVRLKGRCARAEDGGRHSGHWRRLAASSRDWPWIAVASVSPRSGDGPTLAREHPAIGLVTRGVWLRRALLASSSFTATTRLRLNPPRRATPLLNFRAQARPWSVGVENMYICMYFRQYIHVYIHPYLVAGRAKAGRCRTRVTSRHFQPTGVPVTDPRADLHP